MGSIGGGGGGIVIGPFCFCVLFLGLCSCLWDVIGCWMIGLAWLRWSWRVLRRGSSSSSSSSRRWRSVVVRWLRRRRRRRRRWLLLSCCCSCRRCCCWCCCCCTCCCHVCSRGSRGFSAPASVALHRYDAKRRREERASAERMCRKSKSSHSSVAVAFARLVKAVFYLFKLSRPSPFLSQIA